ncbi:GGDEF domain-containing protein [Alcanivorax quisquiliarum]|uniref:diguanylate cyclase n=1 Tax=Alcanivorax quisquiliarum TaxID=2933565 RepID=A0ABT0E947_9GAMM|nr:GGDEF domain-containing protein [Alcanivorax quisquiliarum]MCK0538277.1 GGDEF domain-containing protein [Alcanivorax quisquiliarum]
MQGWFFNTGLQDSEQARIVRRVLFALVAGGLAHTLVCWIAAQLGFFRGSNAVFFGLFLAIWSGHVALILFTLAGLNRRLRDPAMTMPVIWWSTTALLVSAFYIDQARLCVMLLFFAILQTGVFRSRRRDLVFVGIYCVLVYLAILLLVSRWYPEAVDRQAELIQWGTFAVMTLAVAMLASEIGTIRNTLARRNRELGEIVERIQRLAVRDELTGLYNRRYAMERLAKIREMAGRGAFGVVIAYADLDHFKQINDTYGHALGDEVLRRFAERASALLSGRDFCARFGGEEFLLVLAKTDMERARSVLEQLRGELAQEQFEHAPALRVTVSQGLAEYIEGEPLEAWLARADEALYRAKGQGRNRTVVAPRRPLEGGPVG